MQITLEEAEILAAVKEYIKNQGLSFGEREPKVTLAANGNKKNPDITASIELNNALKIAMGPGEIETLPDKAVENKAAFTPEPAPKKVAPKQTKKAEEPEPKPEPVNNKEPELVEEETPDAPEPKEEVAVEDLFGGAAGNTPSEDPVEEEELVEEDEGAVTADSLFA